MKRKDEATEPVSNLAQFTKEQFLQSRQRSGRDRDLLAVVLQDGQLYTIAEAEKEMDNYLKRSVQ